MRSRRERVQCTIDTLTPVSTDASSIMNVFGSSILLACFHGYRSGPASSTTMALSQGLTCGMELCKLLAEHPSIALISDAKKVRCSLTGHEMPARVQDILAYVNGQKYKRLRSLADYDYSAVEPYLVQSNRRSQQLYCRLTGHYINKLPDHVERHRKGKRFTSALDRYKKGESVLFDEIHVKEKGESNHAITDEDQYGRIRITSVGIGGKEETQVNSDGCGAEWREDGEMEEGPSTSTEKDDDEWNQEGMVDGGRGEESDISGGECSVKQKYKGEEEDFSTPCRGGRKKQKGALGTLQGAKATAKKKRGRKKFSRNFISSREKLLNF